MKIVTALRNINIPSGVTTIGYSVFSGCNNLRSITLSSAVAYVEHDAITGALDYTIYAETDYEPSEWYFLQDFWDYSVFWGCTLSTDKSYVVSIDITNSYISTDPLYPPYRAGYVFLGWSETSNSLPKYSMEDITCGGIASDMVLYTVWEQVYQ